MLWKSTNKMDTNLIQYIFGKVSLLEVNRGVPKRLRDRSAKPSFTGSTPVSASRSSTRIWVHSSADRAPVSGTGDHGFESHWTHLKCSCSSVVRALVLHTRSRWFESIHEHVSLKSSEDFQLSSDYQVISRIHTTITIH